MRQKLFALLAVGVVSLVWGCYPKGPEYVDEYGIAYTNYDSKFDFSLRKTYSLPSEIVKIDGDPNTNDKIKDVYAFPILQTIDDNMQANGWTKVDINANPDVQILPAAWSTTTIVGGYWGNYWCWYYPYYCGGGWYYPYTYYGSYTTGTLLIQMIDPTTSTADDSRKVAWTAALNGLLGYTSDVSRIQNGVNQAFKQSPYLKIK